MDLPGKQETHQSPPGKVRKRCRRGKTVSPIGGNHYPSGNVEVVSGVHVTSKMNNSVSQFRRLCASPLRYAIRLLTLGRSPTQQFRILLFHGTPRGSRTAFESLVSYIANEHGVVKPDEAASWLDHGLPHQARAPHWKAPVLFTFDDGFSSNFEIAAPILDAYGIKALFFVCPGLINLPKEIAREAITGQIFESGPGAKVLSSDTRLMNWQELAELKKRGHTIGCHGMSHRRLSELSGETLRQEVIAAGGLLDAKLQQQTDWYAYAFGDIGSISEAALQTISERYRYCRSGLRGPNGGATPALALKADSLTPDAPLTYQKLLLEGGLDLKYAAPRRTLDRMLSADSEFSNNESI